MKTQLFVLDILDWLGNQLTFSLCDTETAEMSESQLFNWHLESPKASLTISVLFLLPVAQLHNYPVLSYINIYRNLPILKSEHSLWVVLYMWTQASTGQRWTSRRESLASYFPYSESAAVQGQRSNERSVPPRRAPVGRTRWQDTASAVLRLLNLAIWSH